VGVRAATSESLGLPSADGQTASQLLASVKEARAKVLAGVKSGKGSVVISDSGGSPRQRETWSITFAFSGDRLALSGSTPSYEAGNNLEAVSDGHVLRVIDNGKKRVLDVNSKNGRDEMQGMMGFVGPVQNAYTGLEQAWYFSKSRPRIVGHESIDGSDCIMIESVGVIPRKHGSKSVYTRRVWVDPARGYTMPRILEWAEGGASKQRSLTSRTEVRLVQYDGIWGASRLIHEDYRDDSKTGKRSLSRRVVVTFSEDFALNVPVSDSDLKLPLPGAPVAQTAFPEPDSSQSKELQDAKILAGITAVEGPGVIVTLRDSPKRPLKGRRPEIQANYTVHDSDVRNIVNELFAAGAEAVSVNGQRIVATSSIRCVGPVMLVNSVHISMPIEIKAIGNADVLGKALTPRGGVAGNLQLLDMLQVKKQASLTVPAYKGTTRFNLARPTAKAAPAPAPAPAEMNKPPRSPEVRSPEVVVFTDGEVARPGAYAVGREERIADLIKRAGGLVATGSPRGVLLLRGKDLRQDRDADGALSRSPGFADKQLLTQLAKLGIGLPGQLVWAFRRL
jgi:hypothetical protein